MRKTIFFSWKKTCTSISKKSAKIHKYASILCSRQFCWYYSINLFICPNNLPFRVWEKLIILLGFKNKSVLFYGYEINLYVTVDYKKWNVPRGQKNICFKWEKQILSLQDQINGYFHISNTKSEWKCICIKKI